LTVPAGPFSSATLGCCPREQAHGLTHPQTPKFACEFLESRKIGFRPLSESPTAAGEKEPYSENALHRDVRQLRAKDEEFTGGFRAWQSVMTTASSPTGTSQPSALEVQRQVATWFWDQEIFDFVQARLHCFRVASLRHYLAAWELKQAGLDWLCLLLSRCLSGRPLLAAQVQADPCYTSEAERVRAFVAAGGGARSTYCNWSRKLQAPAEVPYMRLRNQSPAAPSAHAHFLKR
jgi:hypothetical protein